MFCYSAGAQTNVGNNLDSDLPSIFSSGNVYAVQTFDKRQREVKGTRLLFTEWQESNIKLKSSADFSNMSVESNFDLLSNKFFLKSSNKIYECNIDRLDRVRLINTRFVREFVVKKLDNGVYALFEELVTGKVNLYSKSNCKLVKAKYNAALDVGSKHDKVSCKTQYFVGSNDHMYPLPSKRKKLSKDLRKLQELATYLNDRKVDLKDEESLISAIHKFNNKK